MHSALRSTPAPERTKPQTRSQPGNAAAGAASMQRMQRPAPLAAGQDITRHTQPSRGRTPQQGTLLNLHVSSQPGGVRMHTPWRCCRDVHALKGRRQRTSNLPVRLLIISTAIQTQWHRVQTQQSAMQTATMVMHGPSQRMQRMDYVLCRFDCTEGLKVCRHLVMSTVDWAQQQQLTGHRVAPHPATATLAHPLVSIHTNLHQQHGSTTGQTDLPATTHVHEPNQNTHTPPGQGPTCKNKSLRGSLFFLVPHTSTTQPEPMAINKRKQQHQGVHMQTSQQT